MKKVSIIGSGNVGVNAAFFIAEDGVADVTLMDIKDGIAAGKALDLMEAAPIRRYRTRITGTGDIADISGSDVVIIAAGMVRGPGYSREALYDINITTIRSICRDVVRHAPEAKLIVTTEPVDGMVKAAVEATGFDRERVIGVGGILDSTRMAHFIARALHISYRDVTAMVIGSHTDFLVPLPAYSRVNGISITQLLDDEAIDEIKRNTRDAGHVIVELSRESNAYYAPSSAIAALTEAICLDTKRVFSVSIMLKGEYGISGIALSVPCKLGSNGVETVYELSLSDSEMMAFRRSADAIRNLGERRETVL